MKTRSYEMFLQMHERSVELSGYIIHHQAERIARHKRFTDFSASQDKPNLVYEKLQQQF